MLIGARNNRAENCYQYGSRFQGIWQNQSGSMNGKTGPTNLTDRNRQW